MNLVQFFTAFNSFIVQAQSTVLNGNKKRNDIQTETANHTIGVFLWMSPNVMKVVGAVLMWFVSTVSKPVYI